VAFDVGVLVLASFEVSSVVERGWFPPPPASG
jgi:hypothetical protein